MRTAEIIKKLLDKPYVLGNPNACYDCLSMLLTFWDHKGIKIPNEWRGWTRENYAERWSKGEGQTELYEFLSSLGEKIENINYMREDDLVILAADTENGDIMVTPAIYLGNNHLLLITIETGIIVIPLWAVKEKIYEVRRLG